MTFKVIFFIINFVKLVFVNLQKQFNKMTLAIIKQQSLLLASDYGELEVNSK